MEGGGDDEDKDVGFPARSRRGLGPKPDLQFTYSLIEEILSKPWF